MKEIGLWAYICHCGQNKELKKETSEIQDPARQVMKT